MIEHAILSMDFHSSVVIEACFSLWWIASTCLLMINTSYSISFRKAKFLQLNFRISTPVPDVVAMFVWEWDCPSLFLSDVGFFFFLCETLIISHYRLLYVSQFFICYFKTSNLSGIGHFFLLFLCQAAELVHFFMIGIVYVFLVLVSVFATVP